MYPLHTNHVSRHQLKIWEPLWQAELQLHPVEAELLNTSLMRRLQFIYHGGAAFINTPLQYNRFQHTIGVLSLVHYFETNNIPLRVAVLLHDIGHFPFSHLLEPILTKQHHLTTEDLIYHHEIQSILKKYSISTQEILSYISGNVESILRNRKPYIHCDHLDSWVRTASAFGSLTTSPQGLLADLEVKDNKVISKTVHNAEILSRLIISEAKFHASIANLGPQTVLRYLIKTLIDEQLLTFDNLVSMNDMEVLHQLYLHKHTSTLLKKLLYESHKLCFTRIRSTIPTVNYFETQIDKLYISMPVVGNHQLSEIVEGVSEMYENLNQLKGSYYIYWKDDEGE